MATIEAGDRIFLREFKDGYEVLDMDYKHRIAIVRSHLAGLIGMCLFTKSFQ